MEKYVLPGLADVLPNVITPPLILLLNRYTLPYIFRLSVLDVVLIDTFDENRDVPFTSNVYCGALQLIPTYVEPPPYAPPLTVSRSNAVALLF